MIPITAKYIEDYFWANRKRRKHDISFVEKVVCEYYEMSVDDMYSNRRLRNIVECRQVIWWVLRHNGATYQAIARQYNKDHTTVISGIRKVIAYLEVSEEVKRNIAKINAKLN